MHFPEELNSLTFYSVGTDKVIKQMEENTKVDMWLQPPSKTPTSKTRSLTSRAIRFCLRLGLLRDPAEAARSWRPTLLLAAWVAAPLAVIGSSIIINLEDYLQFKA